MGLTVYAAPSAEPISLDEALVHCRIDGNEETGLLLASIVAARRQAETVTGCALVTQTLDYTLDAFPCWELEVPKGPLQSVTAITYVDTDGVTQTLSSALYQVDATDERGIITPAWGQSWPTTRQQLAAVKVRYVAGYGAANAVPQEIKQWMLVQIAHWYRNREAAVDGVLAQTPGVDGLIAPYKVMRF